MSDLLKVGALWRGKDKDGKPMLTGKMNGDVRILVLANGFKKEDKHPDYLVYLTAAEKKDGGERSEATEDDLPF